MTLSWTDLWVMGIISLIYLALFLIYLFVKWLIR